MFAENKKVQNLLPVLVFLIHPPFQHNVELMDRHHKVKIVYHSSSFYSLRNKIQMKNNNMNDKFGKENESDGFQMTR